MCFKGSWRKIGSTQLWRLSPLREKCALTKQPLSNVEQLWAKLNTRRSVLANIHSEIFIVGSNIFIAGKSDLTDFLAISDYFWNKNWLATFSYPPPLPTPPPSKGGRGGHGAKKVIWPIFLPFLTISWRKCSGGKKSVMLCIAPCVFL